MKLEESGSLTLDYIRKLQYVAGNMLLAQQTEI